MIILPDFNYELRVVLGATASGSPPQELECVVSYRVTTDTSYTFGSNEEYSAGTTPVSILFGSSTSGETVAVDDIHIYNPDTTGTATVTVSIYNGTDSFILVKQVLAVGETLTYNDKHGWGLN